MCAQRNKFSFLLHRFEFALLWKFSSSLIFQPVSLSGTFHGVLVAVNLLLKDWKNRFFTFDSKKKSFVIWIQVIRILKKKYKSHVRYWFFEQFHYFYWNLRSDYIFYRKFEICGVDYKISIGAFLHSPSQAVVAGEIRKLGWWVHIQITDNIRIKFLLEDAVFCFKIHIPKFYKMSQRTFVC